MEPRPSLALLGTGSLGRAVLSGLAAGGRVELQATTRSRASAAPVAALGVAVTATDDDGDANVRLAGSADLVLVAVKPAGVITLLQEISPALRPGTVVLSVAAGITVASLEAALPAGTPVIRVMTNLPIAVGTGSTALVRGSAVTDEALALVSALFAGAGDALVIDETLIDAFTAVAGSGPGLVYWLLEQVAAQGERIGLTADEAARVTHAMFAAAVAGPRDADAPEDEGEGAIIAAALTAARDRGAELGAGRK